jgi:hypothetical protein
VRAPFTIVVTEIEFEPELPAGILTFDPPGGARIIDAYAPEQLRAHVLLFAGRCHTLLR